MATLGIESTAHTASIGVVDEDAKVLALATDAYRPTAGGIHPREAANHHAEVFPELLQKLMADDAFDPREIEAIAYSQGPGLGPCLRTGATVARTLALAWDKPLVPVNHCVAHIEIARALSGMSDPVLLYASGGNTQIIAYSHGRYRVLGETLDMGVGNFLDKLVLSIGGTFPGGPLLEKWALEGKSLIPLPYSVHGMDVSFSGLYTAAQAAYKKGVKREDLALSVEITTFSMLIEVLERALAHLGKTEVVLGGGVAANSRLRAMVEKMAGQRGVMTFTPPRSLCVDNGAMIAWTGHLSFGTGGAVDVDASQVDPRQRTDHVDAKWR
jgi:N6-L-threonylcarbamoyladenine synthase/N6-L-threonylcarbamoyladenine synthase/protein kinase Bud32